MAKLEFAAAFRANPAGVPLFGAVLFAALMSPLGWLRGWSIADAAVRLRLPWVAVGLGVALGAAWLLRVCVILLA